jgi:hypothetical protein
MYALNEIQACHGKSKIQKVKEIFTRKMGLKI